VLGVSPQDGPEPRASFVQSLFGEDEGAVHADLEGMRARVLAATRGGGDR